MNNKQTATFKVGDILKHRDAASFKVRVVALVGEAQVRCFCFDDGRMALAERICMNWTRQHRPN